MKPPRIELRPLPASIAVVAFPEAYKQSGSALPAGYSGDFFIVQAPANEIKIPQEQMPWLTLSAPAVIGSEISRIDYMATDNTKLTRKLTVALRVRDKPYQIEFVQQGGYLVQNEMVRTLNSPLTIDFLVAITYIAGLIKKVQPPPIKLIVTLIAALAIIALGIVISTARHAFVNVPEPEPLSTDTNGVAINIFPGGSVLDVLPLKNIAAEDQTIALQTVKEIYWLLKQVE